MKKILLLAGALLLMANAYTAAKADTAYLVAPSGYWSDGYWRPTQTLVFKDAPYIPYEGETQCAIALSALNGRELKPSWSFCTISQPQWRHWR